MGRTATNPAKPSRSPAKAQAQAQTPARDARAKKAAAAPPDRKARANALVEAGRRAEDLRAARGRRLLATLRQHLAALAENFVEVGRVLTTLLDERLYLPLGYETFEALLAGERLPSRSQAFKMMGVAAVFERADIRDYGVERAMALIAYTRATAEDDDPVRLLRDNALIGGVAVRDATAADLERARRAALASQGAANAKSAAAAARAKAEKAALKRVAAGLKASDLPKAEVAVTGQRVTATWTLAALGPR